MGRFVLCLMLIALTVLGVPSPALAYDCGAFGQEHQGIGRDNGVTNFLGAQGRIEQRPTTACTPDAEDSFSLAFVMLGESDGLGYAEIGYFRNDAAGSCHCERYFWEYSVDGGPEFTRALWGNPVAEANVGFRVNIADTGYIRMRYDTDLNGTWEAPPNNGDGDSPNTPWKPADHWGGQVPIFDEEILYANSDYKGTEADPTGFTYLRMRNSSGNWVTTDILAADGESLAWQWEEYDTQSGPKGEFDFLTDTFMQVWD